MAEEKKMDDSGPGRSGPVAPSMSRNDFLKQIKGGQRWPVHIYSAANIPKMDLLSESDPYVAVSIVDEFDRNVEPVQVESTLAFEDDANPIWNAYRVLTTRPGVDTSKCKLKLKIYDYDPGDPDDLVGTVITPLSELTPGELVTKPVYRKDKCVVTKVSGSKEQCTLTFGLGVLAEKLQKTVYFIRHGESKWNEAQSGKNVVNMMKSVDHSLNSRGIEQASKLNSQWTQYSKREDEFDEEFFKVEKAYCSPLTRAVQTAVVSLQSHPCFERNGLTLLRNLREAKNLGGQDTVGRYIGDEIEPKVYEKLVTIGKEMGNTNITDIGQQKKIRLTPNDCKCASRWWNNSAEVESEENVEARLRAVTMFLACQPEESAILVGHSLYFRDMVRNFLKDGEGLKANNKELAEQLRKEKLQNAACLAVKLDLCNIYEPFIVDAKLMFGTGTTA